MIDLLSIILLLSGLFVGLNIGVNDAANSIGPTIGASALKYRNAIILFAIFATLGATIQGFHTIGTIGKGVIDSASTPIISLISVLVATAIMVTLFASVGIPVSTTQSILGGIAGIAFTSGLQTNWGKLLIIFSSGFITPFVGIILGYLLYRYITSFIFRLSFLRHESLIYTLLVISSAVLAYSLGANSVGNAMGLVVGAGLIGPFIGGLIGGLALSFGAALLGKKVIKTISSDIIQLDAVMALSIQFSTALTVYLFTLLGIPTPTTPAMLGSLIGIGLVKGVASLDLGTIKKITLGLITSPFIGALLAVMINKLFT